MAPSALVSFAAAIRDVLVFGMAVQKVCDHLLTTVVHAAPIDANAGFHRKVRKRLLDPFQRTRDAALHRRAGLRQVQANDPVDTAIPAGTGMRGQHFAGVQTAAVIVHTKVNRVGMWDVDGDHRDLGSCDFVGDDRGDMLLDLKLQNDVDTFANQCFGGSQ